MQYEISVENIKCGGCSNTIEKKAGTITGIDSLSVDVATGTISATGKDGLREQLCTVLASLGYPEVGTVSGLTSVGKKAKSVASCAVGRMRS